VGAVVAGAGVSEGEFELARLSGSAGVAAGADVRAGAGALSSPDSARAGVAAIVVVASVVVSVDVESVDAESADADVASSAEFICANLSPATAVNAAPAKNSDAYTNIVAVRRFRGSVSGRSSAAESWPYSQLSRLKSFRCGIAFVAPCFERPGRHTGADSAAVIRSLFTVRKRGIAARLPLPFPRSREPAGESPSRGMHAAFVGGR
jgi:hypothetical protein